MISSSPFLTQKSESRCILCDCSLEKKDTRLVHLAGFQGIRNNAEIWSQLDERVCMESPYRSFREVVIRLPTEFKDPLSIHKSCAITFRNRLRSKQEQSEKLQSETNETNIEKSSERTDIETRKKILREKEVKRVCFICNEKSECDEKPYNDGGLARCCQLSSAKKLTEQMEKKISQGCDRYQEAAKRLDIFLNGTSHDVFAADVFYHKGCYCAFTYVSKEPQKDDEKIKLIVLESFNDMFKPKEFIRFIMYPGLKKENLTETRVRMYQKQKVKASEGIIPDDSSVVQHLKRSWLQSFIWRQCLERQIQYPEIDESGWKEEDGMTIPVWYTCSQFPPDMKDLEENDSVNDKVTILFFTFE
eukprot:Seg1510.10 transcript_id=Seg1510.10/GoldUCD/mRNA.D3Y31 product="hypothetical protein" protein_id=Seg1510.10/GoldUCD/D3Y31